MGFGSVCKRLVVLVCAAVALTPATASAATLHVAPAGTDGAPCTVLAPCASFARAYRLAQPGDVVEAAAGTYGDQVIAGDRGAVTFRPALGAAVTVGRPRRQR